MPCVQFTHALTLAVGMSILCDVVWTTCVPCALCRGQHVHVTWITWVVLWVHGVGTPSSAMWCGLPYTVDDSRSQHMKPVVHSTHVMWGCVVELHRCDEKL